MRAVILSSLRRATGNAVTAERLRSVLQRAGVQCDDSAMLDVNESSVAELSAALAGADLLVAVHAYRAGKLYLASVFPPLPEAAQPTSLLRAHPFSSLNTGGG